MIVHVLSPECVARRTSPTVPNTGPVDPCDRHAARLRRRRSQCGSAPSHVGDPAPRLLLRRCRQRLRRAFVPRLREASDLVTHLLHAMRRLLCSDYHQSDRHRGHYDSRGWHRSSSFGSCVPANARPFSACRACFPVNSCHLVTITSQYFGSNSITRAWRPDFSQAINVVPEPPNGSSTVSRPLLLFLMARSTSSTGFIVGCRSFTEGFLMNQTSPWSRAPHQK